MQIKNQLTLHGIILFQRTIYYLKIQVEVCY